MELNLSHIEFSRKYIIKNVKLPVLLTPELAEFLGIMVGDGHLGLFYKKSKSSGIILQSELKISGNASEKKYFDYVMGLFRSLFNCNLTFSDDKRSNAIMLTIYSKSIVQYLNQVCGLPINNKSSIVDIPKIIQYSDAKIKCAFIRGLADTDFSVTFRNSVKRGFYYPIIKADFKSIKLVKDLEIMLTELGFSCCCCYNRLRHDARFSDTVINSIYLYGTKNFMKWNDEIGFSNDKFKSKVEQWLIQGSCPPENKKASGES